MVERQTENLGVRGSTPRPATILCQGFGWQAILRRKAKNVLRPSSAVALLRRMESFMRRRTKKGRLIFSFGVCNAARGRSKISGGVEKPHG